MQRNALGVLDQGVAQVRLAFCVNASVTLAVTITSKLSIGEVLMSRIGKEATVARRVGVLKRMIDTSLMELTEVEVLINARCRSGQSEGGELERMRLVLVNSIVAMDAKLKQLQCSLQVTQTDDSALDASNDGRRGAVMQERLDLKRRKVDPHLFLD